MYLFISNVSQLTVQDFQISPAFHWPLVFGDHINAKSHKSKIDMWLSSARAAELDGNEFQFALCDKDAGNMPLASVLISHSGDDPNKAEMRCRSLTECIYGGLTTALCRTAINHAFDSGFAKSIVASAALVDHAKNKLHSSIPLLEHPSREESSGEWLLTHGVSYVIRGDDPIRSTWDISTALTEGKYRFMAGMEIVGLSKVLMNNQYKEHSCHIH